MSVYTDIVVDRNCDGDYKDGYCATKSALKLLLHLVLVHTFYQYYRDKDKYELMPQVLLSCCYSWCQFTLNMNSIKIKIKIKMNMTTLKLLCLPIHYKSDFSSHLI